MSENKVTLKLLRSWSPCQQGYQRFIEILPNGGTLSECINALVNDGHDDWGLWLFSKCRGNSMFYAETKNGYRNTGNGNTGDLNAGNGNTGDGNAGDLNAGDWNAGDWNTGDRNAGDLNAGDLNAGGRNAGNGNAGNGNTGNGNTGDWNAGDWNAGYWNAGDWNAGERNAGDWNTGDWNTGDWNSGSFNTVTPETILVFNKECTREEWKNCTKPNFIYFNINYWIEENNMTDKEKIDNPNFYVAGGYLKSIPYKEAWRIAWDRASIEDRKLILRLPNFDAKIFKEISGIDVLKELKISEDSHHVPHA